jgi:hypothetical protein
MPPLRARLDLFYPALQKEPEVCFRLTYVFTYLLRNQKTKKPRPTLVKQNRGFGVGRYLLNLRT